MHIEADWFSKIDPYIKVTIGENSCCTKTIENSENPDFNEALFLPSN